MDIATITSAWTEQGVTNNTAPTVGAAAPAYGFVLMAVGKVVGAGSPVIFDTAVAASGLSYDLATGSIVIQTSGLYQVTFEVTPNATGIHSFAVTLTGTPVLGSGLTGINAGPAGHTLLFTGTAGDVLTLVSTSASSTALTSASLTILQIR